MFRPDALVFFRAKVNVSTRAIHFIAAHKPSLGVPWLPVTPNNDLCAAITWIAPRTNFHFRPEEDQSIWSTRRQGS